MAKVEMIFKLFSTLTFLQFASLQTLDKTCSNLTKIVITELELDSKNNWRIIDLSNNSIAFADDPELLRKQMHLETLRLSFNPFSGRENKHIFVQKVLKNFECVKCGFVEIKSQHFAGFASLTELHLNGNKINRIYDDAFKSNENLKLLDLTNNQLTTLPLSMFADLLRFEALYLTENRIKLPKSKPFLKSESLKHLKLDKCEMPAFYPETLSELRNLETLNLNENQIESLPVNTFNSNGKLESLFIAGNRMNFISVDFLDRFPQIKELCLDNNTFVESPEMSKFVKKYVEKNLRTTNCSNNTDLFIENICKDVTTDVSVDAVSVEQQNSNTKPAKFPHKGVSDFFIGSFISFVLILQGAIIVFLFYQLIKMTKFEKLDGEVNYANTILNDDEIYVRIK